jgi:hypothetical protein
MFASGLSPLRKRVLGAAGMVAALLFVALGAWNLGRLDSGATRGPEAVAAGSDGQRDVPTAPSDTGEPIESTGGSDTRSTTTSSPTGAHVPSTTATTAPREDPPPDPHESEPEAPDPPPQDYEWDLPLGDLSVQDSNERLVYNGLVKGCDQGEDVLDERWRVFRSPRNDYLYSAAVHACRGHLDEARRLMAIGGSAYAPGIEGWEGISEYEEDCRTYKAVRSVLDQKLQKDITCPFGGTGHKFPTWTSGCVKVRPTTTETPTGCETSASPAVTSSTTT